MTDGSSDSTDQPKPPDAVREQAEPPDHVAVHPAAGAVAAFVVTYFGGGVPDPKAELLLANGCDGDDAEDFVRAFAETFDIDLSGYDPVAHHGPEAGIDLVLSPLLWLRDRLQGRRFPAVPVTLDLLEATAQTGRWPHAARPPG